MLNINNEHQPQMTTINIDRRRCDLDQWEVSATPPTVPSGGARYQSSAGLWTVSTRPKAVCDVTISQVRELCGARIVTKCIRCVWSGLFSGVQHTVCWKWTWIWREAHSSPSLVLLFFMLSVEAGGRWFFYLVDLAVKPISCRRLESWVFACCRPRNWIQYTYMYQRSLVAKLCTCNQGCI